MYEEILQFVGSNFEVFFFAFITAVIATAAIMDIRDKNYPPGPMGVPLFGYLPFLATKAPYLTLSELSQQYGRIYSVQLGSIYAVIISDIKMLRDAFSLDNFSVRPPLYLNHGINEGKGLIGVSGEAWKDQRQFVTNSLKEIVHAKGGKNTLESRIQASVQDFIKELKNSAGQPTQINETVRHHVGNTLADIVLGTKFDKEDKAWNYLQLVLQERNISFSLTNSFNYVPWLRRLSKYGNVLKVLRDGRDRIQRIYKETMDKKTPSPEPRSVLESYLVEMKRRGSAKKSFTPENIQFVLSDLVNAGWDTTMTSLNWLYLYMALYPHIQERVVDEIDAVVGKRDVTLKDFDQLPYTKAVILEIWRHRSILPLGIPHGTQERTKIGDYFIPKGSMIVPLLWAIHHDGRLWTNPSEFQPERHLNDDGSLCSTENMLPFQTGKRVCVGEDLGRQIVQLFFANTVNQLRVAVPKGSKLSADDVPEYGLTLAPQPFKLRVEARRQ